MTAGPFEQRRVWSGAVEEAQLNRIVTQIAERLASRHEEIVRHVTGVIASGIDDLDDPKAADLLLSSVDANMQAIMHALLDEVQIEQLEPVGPAEEYARFLARAGVSSVALRRAYHFGSDALLTFVFEELQATDADTTMRLHVLQHISSWLYHYIDWVTTAILDVYEDEARALADLRADRVTGVVQEVLEGVDVAPDVFVARTGYRMDQTHVAALLWVDSANSGVDQTARLEKSAREVAHWLGATGSFVFSAVDRTSSQVWFGSPRAGVEELDGADVQSRLDEDLRIAFGVPGSGITGFRRSLVQAREAAVVVRASHHRRVLSAGAESVQVVARLVGDLPALRVWVSEVLGGLAADTCAAADMRETLATYLATNGSLLATSERLHVHRNTVRYRVQKAEQERGAALDHNRIDLELALRIVDLLGPAVH